MEKKIESLLLELDLLPVEDVQSRPNLIALEKFSRPDIVFRLVSEILNPDSVLEFGTWLGASAASWGLHTREECTIICVDTWLGSWEHLANFNSGKDWGRHNLKIRRGRADFFDDFLDNVERIGMKSKIFPISATTQGATKLFESRDIQFPVIYIDAAHDYNPVWQDIVFAKSLLAQNGIILGDDYETWQSVTAAVNDYCDAEKLTDYHGKNSWLILDFLDDDRKSALASRLLELGFQTRQPLTPQVLGLNDWLEFRNRIQTLQKSNDSLKFQLELIRNSMVYRYYIRLRPLLRPFRRLLK